MMLKPMRIDGASIQTNTLDGSCGRDTNSEWEYSQVNT